MQANEQPIQVAINPPIEILVLKGGGAKIPAYVGLMLKLQELGLLDNMKTYAGSSAGGIAAYLKALGYSAEEFKDELNKTDFTQFQDHHTGGILDGLIHLLKKDHGFYLGDRFHAWAYQKIIDKLGLGFANLTFLQLHTLVEKIRNLQCDPGTRAGAIAHIIQDAGFRVPHMSEAELCKTFDNLRDLIVTGTNLKTGETEHFTHETEPNMKLADALRITMSIPGVFRTVIYDRRKNCIVDPDTVTEHDLATNIELAVFVDGGVRDNFPADFFGQQKYCPLGYALNADGTNPGVLGARIDTPAEQDAMWGIVVAAHTQYTWFKSTVATLLAPNDPEKVKKFGPRTISIPNLGVGATDFKLTPVQKQALVDEGEKCAQNYYDLYRCNSAPEILTFKNYDQLVRYEARLIKESDSLNDLLASVTDPESGDRLQVVTERLKIIHHAVIAHKPPEPEIKVEAVVPQKEAAKFSLWDYLPSNPFRAKIPAPSATDNTLKK